MTPTQEYDEAVEKLKKKGLKMWQISILAEMLLIEFTSYPDDAFMINKDNAIEWAKHQEREPWETIDRKLMDEITYNNLIKQFLNRR